MSQTYSPTTRLGTLPRYQPPLLFPKAYLAFVLAATLDIVLTWHIIQLGGWEVNPLANQILLSTGLTGITIFKFCMVLLVVIMCETVGRRHRVKGLALSFAAIAISTAPVVWSTSELWRAFT